MQAGSDEEREALQREFKKADKDKSGNLSRREVRHLVRRIFKQEHRDEEYDSKYWANYANLAFKEADVDNSQTIDFDEFCVLYNKLMNDDDIPTPLKKKATQSLLIPETMATEDDKREYLKSRHSCNASKLSLVVARRPLGITRQASSSNMPELIIKSYYKKYCSATGMCTAAG